MINKRKNNVVVIFAKKPEIGKVKTRIAEETTDQFAFDFAKACFMDLLHKIQSSDYYDLVVATDSREDLSWFQKNYSIEGIIVDCEKGLNKTQSKGKKLKNTLNYLLNDAKYKKALLIPMDIPFITSEDLISAFARLDDYDCVLGPEVNGGVYLIGFKEKVNGALDQVSWSTSHSYEELLKNCSENKIYSLKLMNDLNMPADLLSLRDNIYHNCPILFEFLDRHNYYFSIKDKYINFDDLSICIPVVSNIVIKSNNKGEQEILIQTRYKPSVDKENTGKIEIPSGLVKKYELAQEAVIRETGEETGVESAILSQYHKVLYTTQKNGKKVAIFEPFACQQQLVGDRAYLGLVFVSKYIKGKLRENIIENRNPRWVKSEDLKKRIIEKPDDFFSLSLSALSKYFQLD